MKPAARRALAAVAVLLYLPAYIAGAVTGGGLLTHAPAWAQAVFYAAAGLAWVAPLYPLFVWLRTGASAIPARDGD